MVVIGAGIARWLLLAQGLLDGCYRRLAQGLLDGCYRRRDC